MTTIQARQATVYQGAHRRYLTRAGAARSFFWAAIKRHCECEEPILADFYPGMACKYHEGDHRDRLELLRRRFMGIHFGNRGL